MGYQAMGKPTPEELNTALQHAVQMREKGEDLYFMAKALLNLNYRLKYLEDVLDKAKLYLHSGEAAVEHGILLNAIEAAEKASMAPGDEDEEKKSWLK